LRATNERLNVNFFDLGKHPKLQWLLATTVSPDMGNQYHEWISPKKRDSSNNKTIKFLKTQYPELDDDDIELLAEINSTDDIKQLARDLGWNAKQIKSDLARHLKKKLHCQHTSAKRNVGGNRKKKQQCSLDLKHICVSLNTHRLANQSHILTL
jgi:hypothetical protein